MMDSFGDTLLKAGAFGVTSLIFIYFCLRLMKYNRELVKEKDKDNKDMIEKYAELVERYHQSLIKETRTKVKLVKVVEENNQTMEWIANSVDQTYVENTGAMRIPERRRKISKISPINEFMNEEESQ